MSGEFLKSDFEKRKAGGKADAKRKETIEHEKEELKAFSMNVIFNHHLNAERHVVERREKKEKHQYRVDRLGQEDKHFGKIGADKRKRTHKKPNGERGKRNRAHTLTPEVNRSALRRAKSGRAGQR